MSDECPFWCAMEHEDGEPHASEWEGIRPEVGGEVLVRSEGSGDSENVGLSINTDAGSVAVSLTPAELDRLLEHLRPE